MLVRAKKDLFNRAYRKEGDVFELLDAKLFDPRLMEEVGETAQTSKTVAAGRSPAETAVRDVVQAAVTAPPEPEAAASPRLRRRTAAN